MGMPRIGRRARARHGEVRRQHVVRRGAAGERARARARRGHRHAPARRLDARGPAGRAPRACSRTCTSTISRVSASSGRCSCPDLDITIWGPSSPVQHLAERIGDVPLAAAVSGAPRRDPVAPHVPRRARAAAHDRLGDRSAPRRSRTRARPSATGSRRTGRCSCTSPITSRHSARISRRCRPRG